MTGLAGGPSSPATAPLRIRAQPMVIDDQTGLWRPGQGQGRDNSLSIVTIQHEQGQHVIVANRQTDGQEVLRCPILPHLQYHRATQTFHHWSIGQQRHGLTFKQISGAQTFDDAVDRVLTALNKGSSTEGDSSSDENVFESEAPRRPEKPPSLYDRASGPTCGPTRRQLVTLREKDNSPPLPSRSPTPPQASRHPSAEHTDEESPTLPPRRQSGGSNSSRETLPPKPKNLGSSPRQQRLAIQPLLQASNGQHQTDVWVRAGGTALPPKMTVDLSTKPVLPQKVREYGDYRTDDYRYTSSLDRALDDNNSLSNDKKDTLDSLKPPSSGLGTSDVLLPSKKRRGLLSCFRRRKTPPMLSRVSRQCSYCDAWYTDSQNYKGACRRPPSGCRSLTCLRSCVGSRHSPMRVKSTRIVS